MINLTADHWLAIALGGSIGAVLRFWVIQTVQQQASTLIPIGTLAVNALGCFAMGLAFVYFSLKYAASFSIWQAFLAAGLLGALTTFSTFAIEVLQLFIHQNLSSAVLYLFLNNVISIFAVFLGYWLGKSIF